MSAPAVLVVGNPAYTVEELKKLFDYELTLYDLDTSSRKRHLFAREEAEVYHPALVDSSPMREELHKEDSTDDPNMHSFWAEKTRVRAIDAIGNHAFIDYLRYLLAKERLRRGLEQILPDMESLQQSLLSSGTMRSDGAKGIQIENNEYLRIRYPLGRKNGSRHRGSGRN